MLRFFFYKLRLYSDKNGFDDDDDDEYGYVLTMTLPTCKSRCVGGMMVWETDPVRLCSWES